ncbi:MULTISPECIES: hypothetical protein [Exiguobacterium]|uniref:hypothetical protein n=1 Tax=Exiguobacterium TaxID=33986 RepID=UPI001BECF50F|nr:MULTISPECIES: hypothetical protein [Exiguobacterium]MCT4775676.1 hypothetical protein [Exiguobacterium aquaticum]MCT4787734.1 hypothetical protein [Exiguobacterium mexicanum]
MRRVIGLVLLLLSVSLSAQALSWAYAFVVLDGRVYEVMDVAVLEADLGEVVGEVKTMADDMDGSYYGDASNMYPIGTTYREVNGEAMEDVLAVEDESGWKRAEYRHDAPFSMRDHLDTVAYVVLGIGAVLFVSTRVKKRYKN